MNQYKTLAILTGAALTLAGCSTVKTDVDKGPIQARTFSFPQPRPMPASSSFEPNRFAYLHTMVQDSITQNLAQRGVTKVPAGGNVTVAYLLIVGNNAATTSLDDYFGYGPDASKLVDKVHSAQATGKSRDYFEQGTLFIDFVDPRDNKLLKRARVQRPVLRNV